MPFQSDSFDEQLGLSNAQLTERDAKHVRARLKIRQQQLRTIDGLLIQSQPSSPTSLLSDRFKILTVIDRYRISLAPYKRLPTELVQLIFRFMSTSNLPTGPNSPLVLCKICSSWRRVALAMPELWKELRLEPATQVSILPAEYIQLAQTWFGRAGRFPLSLSVIDPLAINGVNYIEEIIIPFAPRFRALVLALPKRQVDSFVSLHDGLLQNLQDLYVGIHSPDSLDQVGNITALQSSLKLRRFRVSLTTIATSSQFLLLPYRSLETFRCDSNLSAEDCFSLFPLLENIKLLHLRVFHISYYSPSAVVPITFPKLFSLTIVLLDVEPYDILFAPLILPALNTLAILAYDGLGWSGSTYSSLIERSSCRIQDLHLGTLNATPEDVRDILQRTSTLKSITLSAATELTPELCQAIGRSELGLNLTSMFLKGTRDVGPLLDMLEERVDRTPAQAVQKLRFVETHCRLPEEDEAREDLDARLQKISDAGIHFNLLNAPESNFHL